MTGTVRVTAALEDLGVVGAGQVPDGVTAAKALEHLQRLFDRWQADKLLPYALLRTTVALTSGTRDYTIGSGGTINIVRPTEIVRAGFILDSTATDPIESGIQVFTDQEWAEISVKTLDAAVVDGIFFDRGFSSTERGTISTYPTVNQANTQIVLYTRPAAVGYSALTDDLEFPPGFDDAIQKELVRRLCKPFGRPLSGDIVADANEAITAIKLLNHQPVELVLDPSVPGVCRADSPSRWFA